MKTLKAHHISTQISDNTIFKHTSLAKGTPAESMSYDMFTLGNWSWDLGVEWIGNGGLKQNYRERRKQGVGSKALG